MAFDFTGERAVISNNLWAFTSAVGAALCFLVLLVIGVVSLHPRARAHLDRVSFRIVVYALFANMIFGIASAVGGTRTGPGFICGFSIFILQYTLQLSSFLLFCIALNLQLVVVHGINGQAMEKFYLAIPALFSIILVVPPYAFGQYGWDPLEGDCWYTNNNRTERIIWQVTTQMVWTALTVLGEVICSSIVLMFMLRHNGRTRRIFVPVHSISETTSSPQVLQVNRYRYIIFRVALYPITSCCVNLLSVATALHSTISNGIKDQTDYNILLLSDFLYGGRTIVYALLAASDPALVRGVKTLFSIVVHGTEGETSSLVKSTRTGLPSRQPTQVFIELDTVKTGARKPRASPHENPSESASNPPSENKADVHQYSDDHQQYRNPSDVDLAVDIDPRKPSIDDHRDATVGIERERSPDAAAALQRRERDRETQERQREEWDSFKRQI